MPPASPTPTAPPRILAIRRRYLGDLVLLGSVFRNLRLHWPAANLQLLTETGYAAVATLNPDIDAIRTFPRRLYEWPAFLRRIRAQRFTHVLDFDNTDKTALTAWLTRARQRVTQKRDTAPFRHGWTYTDIVPLANATYETTSIADTYLALLQPLQVPVLTRESKLVPKPADLDWAGNILGLNPAAHTAGPPRLLVHPGSRSRFRIWPADRFAAVCDRVQDELDVQVFVVAGPGERTLAHKIREQARSHLVVIDQNLRIGQLAALAARCGVMLCHDSGPMHVAAASGARVVALFGSQNATIWRPIGENHTILQTQLPCTCLPDPPIPCVKEDSYRSYCVRKLTVDEVFAALREQLRH